MLYGTELQKERCELFCTCELQQLVVLFLNAQLLQVLRYHYTVALYNKVVYDQSIKIFNILNSDSSQQPHYYIGSIPNFHLWQ